MSPVAFLKDLLSRGMPLDMAIEAAEAFEAQVSMSTADLIETRRRKDRERKRAAKLVPQNSAESTEAEETVETLSPSPPPPDPPHPAPIPGDIYITRAKAGPTQTEIARGFLAFWAAYPKRVGKDAAAKSFAGAMKRIPSAEPLAVILAGLERALPGWDDPQFIPNPSTWLNQGRWDDDAPAPRTGTPRNAKPDKLAARHDNYAASWAGAEQAAGILAARRAF